MATRFKTIVDIGSQKCTPFLLNSFPTSHHILVEPRSNNNRSLSRNYSSLSHSILNVAVGQSDCSSILLHRHNFSELRTDISADDAVALVEASDNAFTGFEFIDVMSIDTILMSHIKEDLSTLVKVDIDGLDLDVIRSSSLITSLASFIVLEFAVLRDNPLDLFKLLDDKNFQLVDITNHCYYNGQLRQVDIIAVNKCLLNEYQRVSQTPSWDKALWQNLSALDD